MGKSMQQIGAMLAPELSVVVVNDQLAKVQFAFHDGRRQMLTLRTYDALGDKRLAEVALETRELLVEALRRAGRACARSRHDGLFGHGDHARNRPARCTPAPPVLSLDAHGDRCST